MRKLPVFICEDDMEQLSFIKLTIANYIMINDLHMELQLCSIDPFDILVYLEKNTVNQGIYFLDIDLKSKINGIDLAQKIRESDPLGKIIFITTHDELAPVTIQRKVEPLGYIVKTPNLDHMKEQIIECIYLSYCRQIDSLSVQKKLITFKIANKTFKIDMTTVIFIESAALPHKLILYTDDNQYEFYGKLSDFESEYEDLYRCHKAFLINPKKIISIDYKTREIFFSGELSCYFSAIKRKYLSELIN